MNYKNSKTIQIAQKLGYTTAKEFAIFLKIYKSSIETNKSAKKLISLSSI